MPKVDRKFNYIHRFICHAIDSYNVETFIYLLNYVYTNFLDRNNSLLRDILTSWGDTYTYHSENKDQPSSQTYTTPLHHMVKRGRYDILEFILNNKDDSLIKKLGLSSLPFNIVDENGKTLLDVSSLTSMTVAEISSRLPLVLISAFLDNCHFSSTATTEIRLRLRQTLISVLTKQSNVQTYTILYGELGRILRSGLIADPDHLWNEFRDVIALLLAQSSQLEGKTEAKSEINTELFHAHVLTFLIMFGNVGLIQQFSEVLQTIIVNRIELCESISNPLYRLLNFELRATKKDIVFYNNLYTLMEALLDANESSDDMVIKEALHFTTHPDLYRIWNLLERYREQTALLNVDSSNSSSLSSTPSMRSPRSDRFTSLTFFSPAIENKFHYMDKLVTPLTISKDEITTVPFDTPFVLFKIPLPTKSSGCVPTEAVCDSPKSGTTAEVLVDVPVIFFDTSRVEPWHVITPIPSKRMPIPPPIPAPTASVHGATLGGSHAGGMMSTHHVSATYSGGMLPIIPEVIAPPRPATVASEPERPPKPTRAWEKEKKYFPPSRRCVIC